MRVAPGIHRIETPLGDRLLCVYLLIGEEHIMLVDSGVDCTPREYILPYHLGEKLGPRLGSRPDSARSLLLYPLLAHLEHLEQSGQVQRLHSSENPTYQMSGYA